MELDDMKDLWAAQDAKLDRILRLDEQHLRTATLNKARSTLSHYVVWAAIQIAISLALLIWLGSFFAAHIDAPRFWVAAATIHLFIIGTLGSSILRIVKIHRIDYSRSVTAIQRAIEQVKLVEYRALKWIVIASCLIWVPLTIVLFKAFLNIDLYMFVSPAWVVANLALGAVVLVVGQWWSKRYVERDDGDTPPWARKLIDSASGRGLVAVTQFLDELSDFERESR